MNIKKLLPKVFDAATEFALTVALSVIFAMFTWFCIKDAWHNSGPYSVPATFLMACVGVLLVSNAGGLASVVMVTINKPRDHQQ